jgi:hypothetical protein
MKMSVKIILVLISIMPLLASCDFIRDIFPNGKSELTFKLSSKASLSDSMLLSGNDIKWINGTTGEIRFVDSMTIQKIRNFHYIKCYLGTDSLFKATVTIPTMSAIVNDLVLNLNMNNGHFYFEDGYPSYIDNQGTNNIRIQNKEKRTAAWNRFIDQLKKEERYIEK